MTRRASSPERTASLARVIVQAFADREVIAHDASVARHHRPRRRRAGGRRRIAPIVIVNCAAFNDVDGAEDRRRRGAGRQRLRRAQPGAAAEAAGATLVHYSTDFVFDGDGREPYDEDVRPSPRSTYAASKLLGEWFALEAPRAYVLRVESLFGRRADWTGRRGTLDDIVDGLEQGREVRVFTDRVVSPSYVDDVAAATRHLVMSGAPPGLYHCVNAGHATWYDVAAEAARILGVPAAPRADHDRPGAAEGGRVRATARCRRRSWRRRVSRCRRGRTRCAAGSTDARYADGIEWTGLMAKRAVITGITGQDGSYLAELLLEQGLRSHRRRPALERAEPVAHRAPARSHHAAARRSARPAVADAHHPGRQAARVLQPGGDVVRAGVVGSAAADRRVQLDGRDAPARGDPSGRSRRSGSIRRRRARCTGGCARCRRPS